METLKKEKKFKIRYFLYAFIIGLLLGICCYVVGFQSTKLNVFADSTVSNSTFTGSNLNLIAVGGKANSDIATFADLGYLSNVYYMSVDVKIEFDIESGGNLRFLLRERNRDFYCKPSSTTTSSSYADSFYDTGRSFGYGFDSYHFVISNVYSISSQSQMQNRFLANIFGVKFPTTDTLPTLVISKIEIGNYNDGHNTDVLPSVSGTYNYVIYTDTNNVKYYIMFGSHNLAYSAYPQNYLSYRVYYTGSEISDNQAYLDGIDEGKKIGEQEGFEKGKQEGIELGKIQGIAIGEHNILAQDRDYTLLGLMSAVVDAPVRTFTSLFNFEILGFNFKDFILGILTLIVVIIILRKLL